MPQRADYLYQVQNAISGVVTTILPLDGEVDFTYERKDSHFHVDFSDGGVTTYGQYTPFDLEIRHVIVNFTVVYDATYPNSTAARDALVMSFGHGLPQYLTFQMADGTYRYWFARCTNFGFKSTVETRAFAKFSLTFVAEDPYLTDVYPVGGVGRWDDPAVHWDDAGAVWDANTLQWNFVGGVAPTVQSGSVYYQQRTIDPAGNAPSRDIKVILKGPIPGPITLYNKSIGYNNGQFMYMQYAQSLATGHSLTFDVASTGVILDNNSAYADFSYGYQNGQDEWFRLEPTSQVLQINAGGSPNGSWQIIYTPKYL